MNNVIVVFPLLVLCSGEIESLSIDGSADAASTLNLLQQHVEFSAPAVNAILTKKGVGVLYMASGSTYLTQAFTAASSLKLALERSSATLSRLFDISIVLYTDKALGNNSSPFDVVDTHVVSDQISKFSDKTIAMRQGKINSLRDALDKYEYAIYMDSDTMTCDAQLISGILEVLDMGADVAGVPEVATTDWRRVDAEGSTHTTSIIPSAVLVREINGGMIGARRTEEAQLLFKRWAEYHLKSSRSEDCAYVDSSMAGRDQQPLQCALNSSAVSVAYLAGGYNCHESFENWKLIGSDDSQKIKAYNEVGEKTYCGMEVDLAARETPNAVMPTSCFLVHGHNVGGWDVSEPPVLPR